MTTWTLAPWPHTPPRVFISNDRSQPAGPFPRTDVSARVGATNDKTGTYVFLGSMLVGIFALAKGYFGLAFLAGTAGLLGGAFIESGSDS